MGLEREGATEYKIILTNHITRGFPAEITLWFCNVRKKKKALSAGSEPYLFFLYILFSFTHNAKVSF